MDEFFAVILRKSTESASRQVLSRQARKWWCSRWRRAARRGTRGGREQMPFGGRCASCQARRSLHPIGHSTRPDRATRVQAEKWAEQASLFALSPSLLLPSSQSATAHARQTGASGPPTSLTFTCVYPLLPCLCERLVSATILRPAWLGCLGKARHCSTLLPTSLAVLNAGNGVDACLAGRSAEEDFEIIRSCRNYHSGNTGWQASLRLGCECPF
ncbi:unnamed protein product [Protopolystoma xenopodis]|uniref:Uncharacterized protein n=1 Tax=Protopolystoma xenopodis TaxID=117903 RepID=A0A3S5AKC9_9PLAT|nr:unnamed protein product [Protopolystoma xenopodis]